MKRKSQKHLITSALLRLMLVNILLAMATSTCGLIDNLFIGRKLDSDAPCVGCDTGHPVFSKDLELMGSLENFYEMSINAR